MSAGLYPGETADLLWHWNEAEGEIKKLRSSFPDEARLKAEGAIGEVRGVYREVTVINGHAHVQLYEKSGLWCGAIEPTGGPPPHPHAEMNDQAVAAASRDKLVVRALAGADASVPHLDRPWTCAVLPSEVLRLVFREPMVVDSDWTVLRRPFGLVLEADYPREHEPFAVRVNPLRGPGNLAHLVPSAVEAFARARTHDIGRWVDRLGVRLQRGRVTPEERELQKRIYNEAELLQIRALELYRRARARVPDLVRRRAADRLRNPP